MKVAQLLAVLFVSAFIYHLSQPNFFFEGSPSAAILGYAGLIFSWYKAKTKKEAFYSTFLFCFFINIFSFHWVLGTLQEFGGLNIFAAFPIWLCFSLLIFPHYFLFAVFFQLLRTYYYKNKSIQMAWEKAPVKMLALAAGIMTLIELFMPLQFPAFIGHSFMAHPMLAQTAQFFGASSYSFFCFLVALLIAFSIIQKKSGPLLFALPLLILPGAGPFFYSPPHKATNNIRIRLVQANIGNVLKLSSENGEAGSISEVLQRYESLSLQPGLESDLIVWPETAYPFSLRSEETRTSKTSIPKVLRDVVAKSKAELLIGSYDENPESQREIYYEDTFNSVFLFKKSQLLNDVYHKIKLLDFGETLPLGPLNQTIANWIPNLSFFAAGKELNAFRLQAGPSIITPICYEILYPEFIRKFLTKNQHRPQIIFNFTNDSWFGGGLEPWQHLFLARWRSIEFQLPLVRATNTGISAWISPQGDIKKHLAYGVADVLDFNLSIPKKIRPTLYARWGYWALFLFLMVAISTLALLEQILRARDHEASKHQ